MKCSAKCNCFYHRECLTARFGARRYTIGEVPKKDIPCMTPDCWGLVDYVGSEGGVNLIFQRKDAHIDREKEAKRRAREEYEKRKNAEQVWGGV